MRLQANQAAHSIKLTGIFLVCSFAQPPADPSSSKQLLIILDAGNLDLGNERHTISTDNGNGEFSAIIQLEN